MLSAKRDQKAAKRFFNKVLKGQSNQKPRVINVDKNASYPPALEQLKEEKVISQDCELRQVKYLNNMIEQDHRRVKRITKASLGYKSFHTAWRTIRGIEIMQMINKGQVEGVKKKDIIGQKEFVESLFGIAI
jgi:transposase-like protein